MAYLPPEEETGDPAQNFKLLPDTRMPLALVFPPLWLFWHRLWLPLLIYLTVAFAISLLFLWQPGPGMIFLSAIPGLYLLLEGSELIRRKYERNGWRFSGIVEGENEEEAEIRFLEGARPGLFVVKPSAASQPKPARPAFQVSTTSPGLFPE